MANPSFSSDAVSASVHRAMKCGGKFLVIHSAITICVIHSGLCASDAGSNNPAPLHRVPPAVQPAAEADKFLKWDAITKEQTIAQGTNLTHFTFHVTNASPVTVTIQEVYTSCGCTAAALPQQPWPLAPGDTGEVSVAMDVAEEPGVVIKTVTLLTDKGPKVLYVKTTVLAETNAVASQPVPATRLQQ